MSNYKQQILAIIYKRKICEIENKKKTSNIIKAICIKTYTGLINKIEKVSESNGKLDKTPHLNSE